MENKTERVGGEKVFCHTYDSMVRELSKNMMVREEMLLPKEGEESVGNHESIFSWIKAVDFVEGKTPAIEATFSSNGGGKTVKVDTEEHVAVSGLEEKASKEDLLYSMALTEAKMKVISTIAEDVYPAVAFQISDYRKDMEKMRDEILGNKKEVTNFNEVMHSALSRKNIASIVVIGSMLMIACGAEVNASTTAPATRTTPAVTETYVPPKATATEIFPTATATETQIPIKNPGFSRKYQPGFKEHYEAEVYGMKIPIDIGLSHWVRSRPDRPIKEVHLGKDIPAIYADIYLRECHYRFTHMMKGNEGVTFEEYIDLVKQGKGNIDLAVFDERKNGIRPEVMSIDPRAGFAISWVDEPLPIKINDIYSMYYGTDGIGRYLVAGNLKGGEISRFFEDNKISKPEFTWDGLFFQKFGEALGVILSTENYCLESLDVQKICGIVSQPPEYLEIYQKFVNILIEDGKSGKRTLPIIEVVEE
jgi:hypothetical protein